MVNTSRQRHQRNQFNQFQLRDSPRSKWTSPRDSEPWDVGWHVQPVCNPCATEICERNVDKNFESEDGCRLSKWNSENRSVKKLKLSRCQEDFGQSTHQQACQNANMATENEPTSVTICACFLLRKVIKSLWIISFIMFYPSSTQLSATFSDFSTSCPFLFSAATRPDFDAVHIVAAEGVRHLLQVQRPRDRCHKKTGKNGWLWRIIAVFIDVSLLYTHIRGISWWSNVNSR